jgi:hypothetical protein
MNHFSTLIDDIISVRAALNAAMSEHKCPPSEHEGSANTAARTRETGEIENPAPVKAVVPTTPGRHRGVGAKEEAKLDVADNALGPLEAAGDGVRDSDTAKLGEAGENRASSPSTIPPITEVADAGLENAGEDKLCGNRNLPWEQTYTKW